MRLKSIVFAVLAILVLFGSCKSAPKQADPKKDVWTMLAKGDDRAKDFFLGEVNVHATDSKGRTPLHYAAEQDNAGLAAFFIAMGADVNAQDNSGQTPLGLCAEKGSVAAAKVIATAGADIHKPAKNGISPAKMALKNNDFLRAILTPASLLSTDREGMTVLHLASEAGNAAAVRTILSAVDSGGDTLVAAGSRNNPVDKKDNAGCNPLDIALKHPDSRDHMEVAEQLILAGAISEDQLYYYLAPAVRNANYDMRRADGLAPLHYAAGRGYEGLIGFLLERKADVNLKNTSGATPLHEAVRSGNMNALSMIIKSGADINAQDANGNSVLHIGMPPENQIAAVNLLLASGANPNLRDEHGDTPLHVLITLNRNADVVGTILNGGADVSARNVKGQTPLHLAIQENRISLIPLLLSGGSDIFAADNAGLTPFDRAMQVKGPILDALITDETVNQRDSMGNTMLHAAVRNKGDIAVIMKILDKNGNVNARNRDGETALHIAARTNQKETGEYILAKGADIFSADAKGQSPLYIALTHPSGVLQWMFNERTVAAHDGLGNTMLHYVAMWKMDKQIPFIIQKGVNVDAPNATGETPLFWAVRYDGASTVKTLLASNAQINARDCLGNSVLHSAVRWNAKSAVNALLDSGIDVNAHNLNGTTPLHDSVRLGITDIAVILINRGADIEVRDAGGNTPFMEAVKAGYVSAADLLAKRGANAMTRNANGDTPLHYAVMAENSSMIQALLGMGTSIHARNTKNRTPFQIALTDSPAAVSWLLAGTRINAPDDFGNSPLHVALQEKVPPSTLKVIIDKGARLSAVDSNGRIPLRLAVDMAAWDSAKLLADAGSDPFSTAVDGKTSGEIAIARGKEAICAVFSGNAINAKDPSGNTALHYAARMGKPEAVSILLELGASKSVRNISSERPVDIAMRWNNRENATLLN